MAGLCRTRIGVSGRREHDAHGAGVHEAHGLPRGGRPPAAAASVPSRSPSTSGSTTCASGSPNRTLNSITFGPDAREHEAAIEEAAIRVALGAHAGNHGRDYLVEDAALERRVAERAGGEGAHAARVRTVVPVEDALVILRRAEGHHALAVAQHEVRQLAPSRHSSITTRAPASPKRRSRIIAVTVASAVAASAATTTPLPAARPSAFSTTG